MNQRIISFLKYGMCGVVVFALVVVSGCNKDEDKGPTIFSGTVLALAQSSDFKQGGSVTADKALDSLLKYLTTFPELTGLLSAPNELTFFAPSNQAFINLLALPGFPSNIAKISPSLIKGVLAYHIVSDKLLVADLTPTGTGAGINTNFSYTNPCTGAGAVQVIKVNSNGTLLTGSQNSEIEIVTPDKQATNGVMHVVATVLIPPAVGQSLTPILGTLAGTVLLGADFSYMAALMTYADCGTTSGTPLSTILAIPLDIDGDGSDDNNGQTAFLIPNAVFQGGGMSSAEAVITAFAPTANARAVLLNHIVQDTYPAATLTNGLELNTKLEGSSVTVTVSGENILLTTGGASNVPIVSADIAHNNGVAHVIGGILLPQ